MPIRRPRRADRSAPPPPLPVDPVAVAEDEQLIERLRAGWFPAPGDELLVHWLFAWRAVQRRRTS